MAMPRDTSLSRRVRQVRERLRMTQQEFAERIGLKEYQIGDVERGNTMPSAPLLRAVVDFYGVDATWLLTGRGEPFSESPTTPEPEVVARVLEETVYRCEDCRGEVEPKVKRCMHCGAYLRWPDENAPDRS